MEAGFNPSYKLSRISIFPEVKPAECGRFSTYPSENYYSQFSDKNVALYQGDTSVTDNYVVVSVEPR